ncbi:hypothetical protein MAR_004515 [Mya arenaria]|uniref:Uncharacterized protein n=1 Tax=Mya arenaria TaxID=6604 RepID=A0ABY7EYG8_MYAAR|nr:hypothetical protein MAR_004515 [Mya arenaria]
MAVFETTPGQEDRKSRRSDRTSKFACHMPASSNGHVKRSAPITYLSAEGPHGVALETFDLEPDVLTRVPT